MCIRDRNQSLSNGRGIKGLHKSVNLIERVDTLHEALTMYDDFLKSMIKDEPKGDNDRELIELWRAERKVLKDMLNATKLAKWIDHGAAVIKAKRDAHGDE